MLWVPLWNPLSIQPTLSNNYSLFFCHILQKWFCLSPAQATVTNGESPRKQQHKTLETGRTVIFLLLCCGLFHLPLSGHIIGIRFALWVSAGKEWPRSYLTSAKAIHITYIPCEYYTLPID